MLLLRRCCFISGARPPPLPAFVRGSVPRLITAAIRAVSTVLNADGDDWNYAQMAAFLVSGDPLALRRARLSRILCFARSCSRRAFATMVAAALPTLCSSRCRRAVVVACRGAGSPSVVGLLGGTVHVTSRTQLRAGLRHVRACTARPRCSTSSARSATRPRIDDAEILQCSRV